MRIRMSVPAVNAHRHMMRNDVALSRSLERLSSGLRVNRAGDDAAGLSISETLRAQVRGTAQAFRNVQDGLGFVHSVDGKLQQVSGLLQRARELTVQAGNGSYTTADRQAIQAEIGELFNTIRDLTGEYSGFNKQVFPLMGVAPPPAPPPTPPAEDFVFLLDNTTNPINGTMLNDFVAQLQNFATQVQAVRPGSRFGVALMNTNNSGTNNDGVVRILDLTADPSQLSSANLSALIQARTGTGNNFRAGNVDPYSGIFSSIGGATDLNGDDGFSWSPTAAAKNMVLITGVDRETDRHGPPYSYNDTQTDLTTALTAAGIRLSAIGNTGLTNSTDPNRGLGNAIAGSGGTFYDRSTGMDAILADFVPPPLGTYPYLDLHIGANQGQKMQLEMSNVTLNTLGLSGGFSIVDGDVGSELARLDNAQRLVSLELSKWGSYASRLEHIAANLTVSQLNQMTAESRIRDTDFAEETTHLTRAQLLSQSSASMLGRAQRDIQGLQQMLFA